MKKLQSIIHDFYRYLGIPIQFTNENESLILEEGLSSPLKFYCQNQFLISAYKSTNENLVQLKHMKEIHFFIWPFIQQKQTKGYFIVGPFQCQEDALNKEVPYKPACCINLIGTTLKMIINHYSCAVQFNPYIKESIDYIHMNFDKNISLDELCGIININKSYFCSLFKHETGMTFSNFLNLFRIEKSKYFLIDKHRSILDVALGVGYNNQTYYCSLFKKQTGMTPLQYRHLQH